MDGEFKSDDEDMTFELLAAILMQLSQQTREPKMASEAFKAISYLIFDIHRKNTVIAITDSIAQAVSTATKRVQDKLMEATDQLILAVAKVTKVGDTLKTDCQETYLKFKSAMEEASMVIKENSTRGNDRVNSDAGERKLL